MTTNTNAYGSRQGMRATALALLTLLLAAMLAASAIGAPSARADGPFDNEFIVNETQDAEDENIGDGICDADLGVGSDTSQHCTLRAAIQEANATNAADQIRFAIFDGTNDVKTLHVGANVNQPDEVLRLPSITNPVTIDGYTQPGAHPNTKAVGNDAVLRIRLQNDTGRSIPPGLQITSTSGSTVIRGLIIGGFGTGISLDGDTLNNRIEGNFIGTEPGVGGIRLGDGNDGNGVEITNVASENVIGGPSPAARNVISSNGKFGILINAGFGNRVENNYIGTDGSGSGDRGNAGHGISVEDSTGNIIGGTASGTGNVISGNFGNGVRLSLGADLNKVLGNRIGTTASGAGSLGNQFNGVEISGSPGNSVGDGTPGGANTIAFNGSNGVRVSLSTSRANEISRNSIFSNAGLGIDLSGGTENGSFATANDAGDVDSGPNGLQNFPVLTSAKSGATDTTIAGNLNSTLRRSFNIRFFSNAAGTNEGRTFIGQKLVTTDDSGNASFAFTTAGKVPLGQTISATATDQVTLGTSEFSAPKTVGDTVAPSVTSVSPAENATGVSPSANFSAVFSEAMTPSTINANTVTLRKAGSTTSVAATVTYDAAAKRAILNPGATLTAGATYIAAVTPGARDSSGDALDQDASNAGNQQKTWKFTVKK